MIQMGISTNYYVATLRNALEMSDFKTIVKNDGVEIRIAKSSDDKLRVQSILFPREKYTIGSARMSAILLENNWV